MSKKHHFLAYFWPKRFQTPSQTLWNPDFRAKPEIHEKPLFLVNFDHFDENPYPNLMEKWHFDENDTTGPHWTPWTGRADKCVQNPYPIPMEMSKIRQKPLFLCPKRGFLRLSGFSVTFWQKVVIFMFLAIKTWKLSLFDDFLGKTWHL